MSGAVLVAVSQRVDVWPDRDERRDALDQRLALWLARAGCLALPVPNGLADDDLGRWLAALVPGGVLLSGGNDIGEAPERDATERALLTHAEATRLPALGLCRGLQMMTVWAGGTLAPVAGHVRARHRLDTGTDGWPGEVNSYHGWAPAACPPGFVVAARSVSDGAIEAIRHEVLPWEGWMWHPERERPDFTEADTARARRLFHRDESRS